MFLFPTVRVVIRGIPASAKTSADIREEEYDRKYDDKKTKKKAFSCLTFLRKTLVVFLWMSSSCGYTAGGCISVLFRSFHGSPTTKSGFPGYSWFFFLTVFFKNLVKIENIVTRTFSIQLVILLPF